MALRDAVRAHWQKQLNGTAIEVRVPEWDAPDQACTLYFRRNLTLSQRIALEAADRDEGKYGYVREFLFLCARDENDKALFSGAADRKMLSTEADPAILTRITSQVLEQIGRPTMEEAEGNSAAART